MKVGETYKSKYNHYLTTITRIDNKYVYFENFVGVKDKTKIEHFNNNWIRHISVYEYVDMIKRYFNKKYLKREESIIVLLDNGRIEFSISDNKYLDVTPINIDLGLKKDTTSFLLDNAEEVIQMLASLVY